MPAARTPFVTGPRRLLGAALGLLSAVVALAYLMVAGVALGVSAVWPPGHHLLRRAHRRVVSALIHAERTRLAACFDHPVPPGQVRNPALYLGARGLLGAAGGYTVLTSLSVGGLLLAGAVREAVLGRSHPVPLRSPGIYLSVERWSLAAAGGLVLVALGVLSMVAVAGAERRLADRFLGPGPQELMRRRIAQLTETRAGIVRAVDDERRRIERDLHDGAQQRVVALTVLLGRARRGTDPERTGALLSEAYAQARRLTDELREVAWRIYPTALDELGLRAALAGVTERAGLPVSLHYRLTARPAQAVETAVYFIVREAITNAAKHAAATGVLVVVDTDTDTDTGGGGDAVSVTVSDDGRGGADPHGGGLAGLARRVSALDGRFTVDSPPGGPTTVTALLPATGSDRSAR